MKRSACQIHPNRKRKKQPHYVSQIILQTARGHKLLTLGILCTVFLAVVSALLPPLVLERIVNLLSDNASVPFRLAVLYFALIVLTGILESFRESFLTIFGQKITHSLRSAMCRKLSRLSADDFTHQEPGTIVACFVGDVDTVEALFTSGIISMVADLCKLVSIFAIIFVKNQGLAMILLLLIPVVALFTRIVQKRMLKAQSEYRRAVAKVTNHVPETIHCIRTIHALGKEPYMRRKYKDSIDESYQAMEKTNFYDAVYSPVILILNALVTAAVLLLSASANPRIQGFFGMSVGTCVAVISYISQVFSPLESIGMEIQTIQSAFAGVRRIHEFLSRPEKWDTDRSLYFDKAAPCIEMKHVYFHYGENQTVLQDFGFTVQTGEYVTLAGRTGSGKSTVFKLLLGLYRPQDGQVLIHGQEASLIPDSEKRKLFGYVEQSFRMVPGSVAEQITLFDETISQEQIEKAARTVGLHKTICQFSQGYETICTDSLFSQGQWQLLSIARAIAADPEILLLDEITANLDSGTEQLVLTAIQNASRNRTVLSISHRLYADSCLGGQDAHDDTENAAKHTIIYLQNMLKKQRL